MVITLFYFTVIKYDNLIQSDLIYYTKISKNIIYVDIILLSQLE